MTTHDLRAEPNPFTAVAALILNPPPAALIDYLEHFRDLIGASKPGDHQSISDKMIWSIDHLIRWLPAFQHLPAGMGCPKDIAIALEVLPRVRKYLEPMLAPKARNRPTNVPKKAVAEIIVTACRHYHPEIARGRLYEVCETYWQACGGAPGDLDHWWRLVTPALKAKHPFFEMVLTTHGSR
jgi:hypothetical protein